MNKENYIQNKNKYHYSKFIICTIVTIFMPSFMLIKVLAWNFVEKVFFKKSKMRLFYLRLI